MINYNEIISSDGQVRPHYSEVYSHWKTLPPKIRRLLHTRSRMLFSGDYHQDPLPRILTQAEFQCLKRGVDQRARAILAFLRNYCTRGLQWKRIMPTSTLETIILRNHLNNLLVDANPDRLAFPYGPDIIRDSHGKFKVVEDSAGIIGGLGDLSHGHKILYRLVPQFREKLPSIEVHNPAEFYADLALHFSKKAAENGGIPLLYLRAYRDEPDQETRRLARVFERFGIESTTSSNHLRKVIIEEGRNNGIFLKTRGKKQRIGALIFRGSPEQLDRRSLIVDIARLRRCQNRNYLNQVVRAYTHSLNGGSLRAAILKGRAWTNFSLGVQFVNDKVFGLYVDSMIRNLLKETPVLESIPAESLAYRNRAGKWRLDRSTLKRLSRDKNHFVVKLADEDGGSGVWIGRKQTKASLQRLIEKIQAHPEKYIMQEFEHLSVVENRIVDLRLHAHVDSERIIVSNTPWGRANWIHGNGKVNIGSNGFASPVVVLQR